MDNLKRIAYNLDVGPLLVALDERPELWKQITVRQTVEGTSHSDTETIFARGHVSLAHTNTWGQLMHMTTKQRTRLKIH